MITTLGRRHILSYMAGLAPTVAQSIAIGVSSTPPTLGDTSLGLEVDRFPVSSVSIDPLTNKIIFKGTAEAGTDISVSEIGIWSSEGTNDSYLVATFDDFQESWEGGEIVESVNSRFGSSLLNVAITGATPVTVNSLLNPTDISPYFGPNDKWTIGLRKTGAASVGVTLRAISPSGGYADLNFYPSRTTATGYLISSVNASAAQVTGLFDPASVVEYQVIVTPVAGNVTTSTIGLDIINATNAPEDRNGSVLVARSTISTFKTTSASPTDVEYELGVTL